MMYCLQCFLHVDDERLTQHMVWHQEQDARTALIMEYVENAEKQLEALAARVHLLERNAPKPKQHIHGPGDGPEDFLRQQRY